MIRKAEKKDLSRIAEILVFVKKNKVSTNLPK